MSDKKIIMALAICVVIAGIAGKLIINARSTSNQITPPVASKTNLRDEYPKLPGGHVVVRETATATIQRLKEGTGIVFLGFKECPWCQALLPLINEAAANEKQSVYYLDIKQARQENTNDYQRLVAILSPYLAKDEKGLPRISVPDVTVVKDGAIIFRHEMESATKEEQATPEAYWTDARKERTIIKVREALQDM